MNPLKNTSHLSPPEQKKVRVLHVDDETDMLTLTKRFLEEESNYRLQVDVLEDPREVINTMRSTLYDLVLSDYQMGWMDGLELLEEFRKVYPDVPFIIFTGKGREEVAMRALNLGASWYIKKGSDLISQYEELIRVIETLIEKKRLEEALQESESTFRTMVEQIPIALSMFDTDGTLRAINPKALEMWGAVDKPVVGKFNIYKERMAENIIVKSPPQTYKDLVDRTVEGEVTSLPPFRFVMEGRNVWMKGLIFPIFNKEKKVKSIVTARLDVTDLVESQERVSYLQKLLTLAMEQTSVGIIITKSSDGSIEFINTAGMQLLGIPEELLVQINYENHLLNYLTFRKDGAIQTNQMLPLVQASLEGKYTQNERYELTNHVGEQLLTLINASPVWDEGGNLLGGFLMIKVLTGEDPLTYHR